VSESDDWERAFCGRVTSDHPRRVMLTLG